MCDYTRHQSCTTMPYDSEINATSTWNTFVCEYVSACMGVRILLVRFTNVHSPRYAKESVLRAQCDVVSRGSRSSCGTMLAVAVVLLLLLLLLLLSPTGGGRGISVRRLVSLAHRLYEDNMPSSS